MRALFGRGTGGGSSGTKYGSGGSRSLTGMLKDATKMQTMNKKEKLTSKEKYQKIFDDKMDSMKAEMAQKGHGNGFRLPGSKAEAPKPLSAAAQKALEMMAAKKAKKELSKARKVPEITPKSFTGAAGGRIDGKGNIYNAQGQIMFKVDPKSGKIKNRAGNTVGTYKNNSYSDFHIAQLLAKVTPPGGAAGGPMNNPWGSGGAAGGTSSGPANNPWGGGGGNPWGWSNDDKGGGGGWW